MNARLLVVNAHEPTDPPFAPYLVMEHNGNVFLTSAGWILLIKQGALEDTTVEDIRQALHFNPEDCLALSGIEPLPPDDLMSPEFSRWAQQWWLDFVAEMTQKEPLVAQAHR